MDQADTVQRMAEAAGNLLASLDAAGRQKAESSRLNRIPAFSRMTVRV